MVLFTSSNPPITPTGIRSNIVTSYYSAVIVRVIEYAALKYMMEHRNQRFKELYNILACYVGDPGWIPGQYIND